MGDIYRDPRYRDRDDDSAEEYRHTTVRRYKIKPSHDGRYENIDLEDDHRSRYSARTRDDAVEFERRSERPRSVLEATEDRRPAFYERDVAKEYSYGDPDRGRITVYEGKDSDDDKRSRHTHRDDEIRVERHYEARYEDSLGHDVDRYRKETEYYTRASPPPPPVIIRQRQEPQQIILQEAPPPAPVVIPRQEPGVVVIRDKDHHHHHHHRELSRRDRDRDRDRDRGEEEYYYRHEKREVGSWRGDPERDHAMAMASFNRHRHRNGHYSDDDDDGYWVHTRRVVRRERSESPHHKRHLAAGALAGAGITALMTSRPDSHGDVQEHRGRKVIAGTALGALGTEAIRRAHSAYGERYRDRSESPGHHSKLKTGLGIAAVALAAAGAAKYYQANKIEKEEARRGRSRKRSHSRRSHRSDYSGSYSRSPSRSRSRRRSLSTVAKAALGTAATAGLVKHFRDKSKGRSGSRSKSRSKSRLRKAAELGGAAAAAGVATKMWKNHKDKKERRSRERELSDDERAYSRRGSPSDRRSISRDTSRSRSRSRSLARSSHLDSADPELGLVEYGRDPLQPDDIPARGYESEAEERRRRRRRRREREALSDDEGADGERKRSKSRLRDMAAAGVASGAAAFGIKDYKDKKDAEKRERRSRERRERDRTRERSIDRSPDPSRARSREASRDRSPDRSRDRSRNRSRRGGEAQSYFDSHGRSSPPTASGGAYYPPYPATPNAGASSGGYAPYPSGSTPSDYPYAPQDYMGYAPPPAPNHTHPPSGPGPAGGYPAPPPGPPSGPQDHVSVPPRGGGSTEDSVISDSEATVATEAPSGRLRAKSVSFIPLSPQSSRTMERHHQEHLAALRAEAAARKEEEDEGEDTDEDEDVDDDDDDDESVIQGRIRNPHEFERRHRFHHHRQTSDAYPDRALQPLRRASAPVDDVEVLPDRFDADGRPLGGRSASAPRGLMTRSGEFSRRPRREGDWGVQGSWQVGGTDPEVLERMVHGITTALEGRQGLLRAIGEVFAGGAGLLGDGGSGSNADGGGGGENRGRYRRR